MIVAVVITIKAIANWPEKDFGTSTGFEPVASTLALQCSTKLSYEDPDIESRPICRAHLNYWKEWNMKMMWIVEIQI